MHEVHLAIKVVVMEGALGLVDGYHLIVHPQAVALSVSIAEHTALEQHIIAEPNACKQQSTKCSTLSNLATAAAFCAQCFICCSYSGYVTDGSLISFHDMQQQKVP